jgi:hypothetical protein
MLCRSLARRPWWKQFLSSLNLKVLFQWDQVSILAYDGSYPFYFGVVVKKIEYPIQGACQCGNVTYQLTEPPLMVIACHCRECQKLSTSAFSITAVINASTLVCNGELKEWYRTADSGNVNGAKFCGTCGNRIYHFNPDEPEKLKLKPSTLSDTRLIQPTMHVWVSEKMDWFEIPEGIQTFDRQP